MDTTLYYIGAGRVTRIILEGLAKKKNLPERTMVTDSSNDALSIIAGLFPMVETKTDIDSSIAEADFIFIGIHPPVVAETIKGIAPFLNENNTLVSLAPKVNSAVISDLTGKKCPVIRMIPNAPSYVNQGYNPVWYSNQCSDTVKKKFADLMSPLGEMPEVPEENLEAYAVITAMGPTYLWFQMTELINQGVSFGLSFEESARAVFAMAAGAARTMQESGLSFSGVMDLVPTKPMKEHEEAILSLYSSTLPGFYQKLTT